MCMTQTLTTIAAEFGIDTTTARIRCEGLSLDHLGNNTPHERPRRFPGPIGGGPMSGVAEAVWSSTDPLGIVTENPKPTCPVARFGRPHTWTTGAFYVGPRLVISDEYVMCGACGQIECDA